MERELGRVGSTQPCSSVLDLNPSSSRSLAFLCVMWTWGPFSDTLGPEMANMLNVEMNQFTWG